MQSAPARELRYEGVLFSADAVAEERGGRRVVSVARDDIRQIEVCRGPAGERLALQTAFALLLVILGLTAAAVFVGELRTPDARIHINVGAGFIFVPIGALILWAAFRPRYHLRVWTKNDMRKLAFQSRANGKDLSEVVSLAHRVHGYDVEWRGPR